MNTHSIPSLPSPEILPPQEQEIARPELELIQGDGEGAGPNAVQPELYAVPDTGDIEPAVEQSAATEVAESAHKTEQEAEQETAVQVITMVGRRRTVARKSGRLLTRSAARTAQRSTTSSSNSVDQRSGSGGGWVIREHLRKQAAKQAAKFHERSCSCEYCSS